MNNDIVKTPLGAATVCLRTSFGLSLVFMGLTHYMNMTPFIPMVADDLGALRILGVIWAYILPGLLILGGGMYVSGRLALIATWVTGVALGSIPAGLLLKSVMTGFPIMVTLPLVVNTFIWLVVYFLVAKASGQFVTETEEE